MGLLCRALLAKFWERKRTFTSAPKMSAQSSRRWWQKASEKGINRSLLWPRNADICDFVQLPTHKTWFNYRPCVSTRFYVFSLLPYPPTSNDVCYRVWGIWKAKGTRKSWSNGPLRQASCAAILAENTSAFGKKKKSNLSKDPAFSWHDKHFQLINYVLSWPHGKDNAGMLLLLTNLL